MAHVVAVAGLGDEASSVTPSPRTMMLWGIVLGTTIGIFVGTLLLNPGKRRT